MITIAKQVLIHLPHLLRVTCVCGGEACLILADQTVIICRPYRLLCHSASLHFTHRVYLWGLCDSQNKQRLFAYAALTDRALWWRSVVFIFEVRTDFRRKALCFGGLRVAVKPHKVVILVRYKLKETPNYSLSCESHAHEMRRAKSFQGWVGCQSGVGCYLPWFLSFKARRTRPL